MFCKIVVPLDGSQAAEAALVPAMFMARAFQAEVKLVAVPEDSMTFGKEDWGLPSGSGLSEVKTNLDRYLCQKAHELRQESCEVSSEVLGEGATLDVLLGFLERDKPDLLILTSHGRSGMARILIGSVAESLCRTAPCPVFVVGRQTRLFQNVKVQTAIGS